MNKLPLPSTVAQLRPFGPNIGTPEFLTTETSILVIMMMLTMITTMMITMLE